MDFNIMQKTLKDCSLFRGLDQSQLGLPAMSAEAKEFATEDIVYRQGDAADGFFALIVSGKLEASTQQGKRTVTLKAVESATLLQWNIQDIGDTSPLLLKKLKDLAWRRIKDFNE